ncbi:MAG: hypothetical protein QNL91_04590 [Candidatus Krumholzibacteria bacterium]|nr:hypothetical protein [Candidatus Krumholzibacteria bacterium]
MKINTKILWRGLSMVLILPAVAGLILLGGCSNDPVTPQDELPALSADDVATQAGLMAMAAGIVAPQTVDFAGKSDKDSYQYPFTGDVVGVVFLDYYTGGAGGTSAPWDTADYVELYTADDAPLVATVGEGTIVLGFVLNADLDRVSTPNMATINGGGTFASGGYGATFIFSNLVVVQGNSYPDSGLMIFSGGGHVGTVTFNGSSTATMAMSDGTSWIVDLTSGEISENLPG